MNAVQIIALAAKDAIIGRGVWPRIIEGAGDVEANHAENVSSFTATLVTGEEVKITVEYV